MSMHAIAHAGCTDTVRESALKGDTGRIENPLLHRALEPASVLRLAFQSDALYQLSYHRHGFVVVVSFLMPAGFLQRNFV